MKSLGDPRSSSASSEMTPGFILNIYRVARRRLERKSKKKKKKKRWRSAPAPRDLSNGGERKRRRRRRRRRREEPDRGGGENFAVRTSLVSFIPRRRLATAPPCVAALSLAISLSLSSSLTQSSRCAGGPLAPFLRRRVITGRRRERVYGAARVRG